MTSEARVIEFLQDEQAAPDNTGPKEDTRFKPGVSGNPSGRPRGAKNKLGEDFIEALAADFEEHGVETIQLVRRRDPTAYIKVIKDVLPREVLVRAFSLNVDADVGGINDATSTEEILEIVAKEAGEEAAKTLAAMLGLKPPTIELNLEGPSRPGDHREPRAAR
jgi:hypothetical protein